MKPFANKVTILISLVMLPMSGCGKNGSKTGTDTKSGGDQATTGGTASLQIADLSGLGAVKKVKITVRSTDSQGGSYSFTQTEDYVSGRSLMVANLPEHTYAVSLEVIDGTGKVLATGVASRVQIRAGEATNLSISLSKPGQGGTLVIYVKAPVTEPPAVPIPKTVQSLVGTAWSLPGAEGHFLIAATKIFGSDGCNGFEASYIFTSDGRIEGDGNGASSLMACGWVGKKEKQPLRLSSIPGDSWKTYELRDDQLTITTNSGETRKFSRALGIW